ncbi:Putative integral membrane protein TerC family [Herminiimonas arsenicoxydans]|uniref:Integral membrane protein TerC family n=1 Tax=Herminiimonas arsenicoxydans TaxID=204773 RepID=A4G8H2_HERAR|nr:Putative integral membrane protein TerC family [Herminiimonas arsenicoxydans]
MLAILSDSTMWVALFQIVIINILLSGDNAVIIALACRSLPPKEQRNAFLIGTVAIVILMTALTAFASYLMTIPYVEVAGAILLLWIGIKLLLPEEENENVSASDNFWGAVKTIVIADIVMSLDNVLGMAGAANGHMGLLFVGMVITIPLILFGSAMLMRLMERFPIIVTLGAGLLGYVAGEMAVEDPALKGLIASAHYLEIALPILGILIVVGMGKLLSARQTLAVPTEG